MIAITLIQPDIIWEDVEANLAQYTATFESLHERANLILLPELFTTGFTMRSRDLAEPMGDRTMDWMAEQADKYKCDLA